MTFRDRSALLIVLSIPAWGQALMEDQGGKVNLRPSDAAVLDGRRAQHSGLPCEVKPVRPELGFDFEIHSGYDASIHVGELSGPGTALTALFKVTSEANPARSFYFAQKWTVPPIESRARGIAVLHGEFAVGQGKYRVEWLMRDLDGRYCSAHWPVSAQLRGKDKQIELVLPPGTAAAEAAGVFSAETAQKRNETAPLRVNILWHIAPRAGGAVTPPESEIASGISILRRIAREPRVGAYSLTAFSLESNEIVFHSDDAPQIDFPALGAAIRRVQFGAVGVNSLLQKDSSAALFHTMLDPIQKSPPDVLIFVGPKAAEETGWNGALRRLVEPRCPIYYLTYNPDSTGPFWGDPIGSLVKLWRGVEYTIGKPRDLFEDWNEVMSRIARPSR